MIFGRHQRKIFNSHNLLIKLYFVIGSVLIFLFFIIYTNTMLRSFKEDALVVPNLFARFFSYSTEEDWEELLSQYVFEEIVAKIDTPIILTDFYKKPLYWKNIGIDDTISYNELDDNEKRVIAKHLERMAKKKNVIPLYYRHEEDKIINYAFYGESKSIIMLRYMPYIEVIFVLFFMIFGVYAIYFFKRNEKNVLWVGMAKEMAHQLGTPISSLLGWISVLKSKIESNSIGSDTENLISYMENDVNQLSKVAQRFSKIGSEIQLKPIVLHNLLDSSIKYFQQRLPHFTNKIDLVFISKIQDKVIMIDEDLIKWAVENLIKNAIDSMTKKGGNIIVFAFQESGKTHIVVQDEGKGISKSMISKIFEPGISTKVRGWGLGLSLSKRIVKDFHNGNIHVLRSILGEGTSFEIILPDKPKTNLIGKDKKK